MPGPDIARHASAVTIVGAGLAGCWLARELTTRGTAVTLIEAGRTIASGASGNPAGIVKPVASRAPSRPETFYRNAFAYLQQQLHRDGLAEACEFVASGAVQLVRKPFPSRPGVESIDAQAAAERTGLSLHAPAVASAGAGWLHPAALCHALIEPLSLHLCLGVAVLDAERDDQGWSLRLSDGAQHRCDELVLASGPAITRLAVCAHLPITAARGQMDRFSRGDMPRARTIVTGRSWLIPDGEAVWAGATYTREDEDDGVRTEDTAHNREALESLTGRAAGAALQARAGVRATLPDRLPCIGPVTPPGAQRSLPGLSVLGGFGSRGIVTTAWCASLLARRLHGEPDSLRAWSDLLDPGRFERARLRRATRA